MAEFFAGQLLFSFELAGEALLRRKLEGTMRDLGDWRPVFVQIADGLYAHLDSVFASSGATTRAGEWKPLTQRYRAWKERHYPGQPTLTASGKLRRSLTDRNDPGALFEMSADTLTIGSRVRTPNGAWNLGLIHQKGRRDGTIPARAIFSLPDSLTAQFLVAIQQGMSWEASR